VVIFGPSEDPIASIIIVAWRSAPLLRRCLASVAERVDPGSYEVLLVLNEPSSELSTWVDQEVIGARVLSFRANLGFGVAVNAAAERARGRYLVLLNDDCTVDAGWLNALVDTVERRPRCGMVGSKFLHPDGRLQEAGSILWSDGTTQAVGDGQSAGVMHFERKVDYCSGGSLLIRKDLWQSLGGFDERFYPAYHEDADLALRAQDLGWEVWYQPLSVVRHARSTSTGGLRWFLDERSRSIFCAKWSRRLGGYDERGSVERAVWRAQGYPRRVLILDDRVPAAGIGSGYPRMLEVVSLIASQDGIQVDIHPRVGPVEVSPELVRLGVRTVPDLEEHLADPGVSYDTVMVSRPLNIPAFERVRHLLGNARLVYDAEALFYRRLEMQAAMCEDPEERRRLEEEAVEIRQREQAFFATVDAVVCVSPQEADEVRRATTATVHVIEPWLVSPRPTTNGFGPRRHVGFTASWSAPPRTSPNCDGLLWFAREVLPIVRAALPWCRLLVTGAAPPPEVRWLEGPQVSFVGQVPDLDAFYEGIRVAISPTRFGAGVKNKTMEAIQYGVPVVTTSEAAQGLPGILRQAVWSTDDPRDFAEAVIALASDRRAWERCRQAELDAVAGAQAQPRDPRPWLEALFGSESNAWEELAS
jgi:GT2 family glycosyltransferase/glycosyltransferase involved in cell wall biosynthesis